LCHKLSSKCPAFIDTEGEVSFRRLLLNRCQREFEDKNRAMTPAANQTVGDMIEAELKMKRRILGNIRFVGELYRLGMLGVGIVVNCIVSLLPLDRLPDVEDLEVMCNLLMTTGVMLEKTNPKTGAFVKECFGKIQKLANNVQLEARIRFKLQDLIDYRANGWRAVDTAVRRRPSVAASTPKKESVKEVVSVGGKRAVSRVSQQKVSFCTFPFCLFCVC
jgi:translation initiation factor 4G